jgi:metallo-beta-lactamase class B
MFVLNEKSKARRCPDVISTLPAASLSSAIAHAQEIPGTRFDTEGIYQHLKRANELARHDPHPAHVRAHRCIMDQTYCRTISRGLQGRK